MFFHLKKLESPSPKDALCQDWLKLAQWFWRRELFNLVNVFSGDQKSSQAFSSGELKRDFYSEYQELNIF